MRRGLQIARIGASTIVAPAGLYSAADDGSISKAEDYVPKEWSELTDLESWVHIRTHLKKQGGPISSSSRLNHVRHCVSYPIFLSSWHLWVFLVSEYLSNKAYLARSE